MAREKTDDLELRQAKKSDLDAILHIETTANLYMDPDFDVLVARPLAYTLADLQNLLGCKTMWVGVLVEGPVIVGYVVYEIEQTGFHIQSFVVDPTFRRAGLGAYMLIEVLTRCVRNKRRQYLRIHVPDYDRESQEFFKEHHFSSRLVRRFFFDDTDAVLFNFRITEGHRALLDPEKLHEAQPAGSVEPSLARF